MNENPDQGKTLDRLIETTELFASELSAGTSHIKLEPFQILVLLRLSVALQHIRDLEVLAKYSQQRIDELESFLNV